MNEFLENIEDYFAGRLDETARRSFEAKCVEDESFAKEVAFYITRRNALREELLRQKRAAWRPLIPQRTIFRKWAPYAAAASLLLAITLYLVQRSPSPRSLAKNYLENKYATLSQTMDGSTDSLQQGIAAYNDKDYDKALPLFEDLYRSHPENKEALLDAGIVYLRTNNYDKALNKFEELADAHNLHSNPGLFLQAVTLLQRNAPGDIDLAKERLTRVVQQQLDGSDLAAAWLKKL